MENVLSSNDALYPAPIPPKPVTLVDNLFEIVDPLVPAPNIICKSLQLTSGPDAGMFIDLNTSLSEYRKLWNNWKDHFFYILSKGYEPAITGPSTCASSGACITVNATEYAAAVIFSGSRLDGITRNDKSAVADYLEDGKDIIFASEEVLKSGSETYVYTDPQTGAINDIMYCIEDKPIDDPLTPLINELELLSIIECI